MKQLLGILVLGLMLTGNAHTKEILLEKCYNKIDQKEFDSDKLNHHYFKIDTSKKFMNSVVNWKKKPVNGSKVHIVKYKIEYIDDNFVKAFIMEEDGRTTQIEVLVDLNNKIVSLDGVEVAQCK